MKKLQWPWKRKYYYYVINGNDLDRLVGDVVGELKYREIGSVVSPYIPKTYNLY